MPAGAICLSADALVGELSINVFLSSDSGTRRFCLPPSSLCRKVNPAPPMASPAPAQGTVKIWTCTHHSSVDQQI